jgi:hypothetical protein
MAVTDLLTHCLRQAAACALVFACSGCNQDALTEPIDASPAPEATAPSDPPRVPAAPTVEPAPSDPSPARSGTDSGVRDASVLNAADTPRDAGDSGAGGAFDASAHVTDAGSLDSAADADAGSDASAAPFDAGHEAGAEMVEAAAAVVDAGPFKRVFVTSLAYSAELDGPEGADLLCALHAQDAELPGEFRAWLSTASDSAETRLSHADVPYRRTDGVTVAANWDDLVDGTLLATISADEFGAAVFDDVWTGTESDASSHQPDDCTGFMSAAGGVGQCGATYRTDSAWTANLLPSCSTSLRLFCFEQ